MDTTLSETQKRLLATIFERGAESAAQALSSWLGRPVHLAVSEVEQVPLEEASEVLGPGDSLVACCAMALSGSLEGQILLVFEDRAGLALADLLLQQPAGTSTSWGELERSAAMETANIVGCAYLNSLAAHMPTPAGSASPLVPGPPSFRHEFAASLLEFAVMDQAATTDRVLLINTQFRAEQTRLDWSLLFVPSGDSLRALLESMKAAGGK
ncbi:MAG: chemotaxis protein CheC [Isosphaeraceae bacterium]